MFRRITRRAAMTAIAALAVGALGLSGCSSEPTDAPSATPTLDSEPVTLNFTWWGNDDRANRFQQVIDLFEKAHPNITINGTFTDYASYWEKRQTEAAGGGLPDVMQFDYSYLRQYGDNGLLLDLTPYYGNLIDSKAIDPTLLSAGKLGDQNLAIPTGAGPWALYQNIDLLDQIGVEPYKGGGTWKDYEAYLAKVAKASDGTIYGGTDYTQRIQNFELQLREEGKQLFTDDGTLGFTKKELTEFWNSGAAMRKNGAVPQTRLEEILPVSGIGGKLATSEMSWISFLGAFYSDSGAKSITMVPPPTNDAGVKDLYPKVGIMQAASASTEHPAEAAAFIDFIINSPDVAKIFGATLGITGSKTAAAGSDLQGPDLEVKNYVDSVADRIGNAPPAPVAGYGAIEQSFWDLGKSIGLGAVTVDDAVNQFFDEVDVNLGS